MSYDAEGHRENVECPDCGSRKTISYHYQEGFSELECEACGFQSDQVELSALSRYRGDLLESSSDELPPVPMKKMQA